MTEKEKSAVRAGTPATEIIINTNESVPENDEKIKRAFKERFAFLANNAVVIQRKSFTEMANEIGVSRDMFFNYKNHSCMPTAFALVKIADYFGVSTDYLLGREGYEYEEDKA